MLELGCPTRGPRAAYGPLDKLVWPFLLLSNFTPFFKGKKIFLYEGKNFGGDRLLAGIARKNEVPKKRSSKKCWGNEVKYLNIVS